MSGQRVFVWLTTPCEAEIIIGTGSEPCRNLVEAWKASMLLQAKKAFERYQKERGIRDAGSRLGAALLQGNPDVYRELEKKRYPGT
jgi:hypothetical protein